MTPAAGPAGALEPLETATAVVFRCGPHVLAIDSRWVERLLLAEQVEEGPRAPGQVLARARVDGRAWADWDLGLLLGLGPEAAAHVLLRVPWRGGTARLSLRTGPCLAVRPLPASWPLPAHAFARRPGAFPAAFDAAELGPRAGALLGYLLEPGALWTPAELDRAAEVWDTPDAPGAAEVA